MTIFAGKPAPWSMQIVPGRIQHLSGQLWSVAGHLNHGTQDWVARDLGTSFRLLTGDHRPAPTALFGDASTQARKQLVTAITQLIPKAEKVESPALMSMLLAVGDKKVVKKLRVHHGRASWNPDTFSVAANGADGTSIPTLSINLESAVVGDGSTLPFPVVITGVEGEQEAGFVNDSKLGPRVVLPNLHEHALATPHLALQYDPAAKALQVWRMPSANADGEEAMLTSVVEGKRGVRVVTSDEIDLVAAGGAVLLRMSVKDEGGRIHDVATAHLYIEQGRATAFPKSAETYRAEFDAKRSELLPEGTVRTGDRAISISSLPESGVYALVERRANPDIEGSDYVVRELRLHSSEGGVMPEQLYLGKAVDTGEELIALGRYVKTADGIEIDGAGARLQVHSNKVTGEDVDLFDLWKGVGLGNAVPSMRRYFGDGDVKIQKGWKGDSARIVRQVELGDGVLIVQTLDEILQLEAEHDGLLRFALVGGMMWAVDILNSGSHHLKLILIG